MKNKIKIILIFTLLVSAFITNATDKYNFINKTSIIKDNQYKKYWTSFFFTQYVFEHSSYTGGKEQKWIFFPSYPGASDYFIVSYLNGQVLQLDKTLSFKSTPTSELNKALCIFKIDKYKSDYSFRLQDYGNFAITVNKPNQFGYNLLKPFHSLGYPNQTFSIQPISSDLSPVSIIKDNGSNPMEPPSPNGYSSYGIPKYNCEFLAGRTIIPFFLIKDNLPSEQIKNSPYYVLEKYRGWKKTQDYELISGISISRETYTKYGTSQTHFQSMKNTTGMAINFDGKIGFDNDVFSASMGSNVSNTFMSELINTNSTTIEYEKYIKTNVTKAFPQHTLVLMYEIYEIYKLYRADNLNNPIKEWEVTPYESNIWRLKSYPASNPTQVSNLKSNTETYSRRIILNPINKSAHKTTSNLIIENKVLIFPNPAIDNFNINFSLSEEANIEIQLSDISGKSIRILRNSSKLDNGNHNMEFDTESLVPGTYFIKLSNNGYVINTQKFIIYK